MQFAPPLKLILVASAAITAAVLLRPIPNSVAASLRVEAGRWLAVRQMTGKVLYQNGRGFRQATTGLKLRAVGDTIQTGDRSSTILDLDTSIGFIKVAEKTTLRVKQLQALPNGGRVTQLDVTGGQARFQVRPFNHRSSRLEVVTPAGISGVRGTEFGVVAQESGKMGVATLTGSVVTTAQGKLVAVNARFQSLVMPGEPPDPATPLKDDPSLDVTRFSLIANCQAIVSGQTDGVNFVLINDLPQNTDREGRFETTVPITNNQFRATVITPLGKRQDYRFPQRC